MKEKRWLNTDEFESEFGIKKVTQALWRKQNKIPYSKLGNFIYYDRFKIDKWLEEHDVNSNSCGVNNGR